MFVVTVRMDTTRFQIRCDTMPLAQQACSTWRLRTGKTPTVRVAG